MCKMGSHDPFEHLKHKLWPKERPGVKLVIWLSTLKVGNRFDFLACRFRATYRSKAFNEGYNFVSDLISIGGLHTKLWGPKVMRVLTLRISGHPFGSPETKCHLDVGILESTKYAIRGKVVASPKFGPWWVLWVRVCPWLVLAPKVF
jgi:hypothetical protein